MSESLKSSGALSGSGVLGSKNVKADKDVKAEFLPLLYEYLILSRVNLGRSAYAFQKKAELEEYVSGLTEEDFRDSFTTCVEDPEVHSVIEALDASFISSLDSIASEKLEKYFNSLVEKAVDALKQQEETFDENKWFKALPYFKYTKVEYALPSGKLVTADDFQLGEAKFKQLYDSYRELHTSYIDKQKAELKRLNTKLNEIKSQRMKMWIKDNHASMRKEKMIELPLKVLSIIFFLAAVVWLGVLIYLWIVGKMKLSIGTLLSSIIWLIPSAIAGGIGFLLYAKAEVVVVDVPKTSKDFRKEEYDELEKEIAKIEKSINRDPALK